MKNSRRALFHSIISLVLCFSMLVGTTFAWFTDTESSMNNIIQSGNLDIEMYWNKDLSNNWTEVDEDNAIFDYDKWEPGYTEVRYVKIVNEGNLAFKYMMNVYALGEVGILADVIDVYYIENPTAPISGREALDALTPVGVLSDVIKGLLPTSGTMEKDDEIVIAIALKMQENAGNKYMGESVGDSFTVQLIAAQLASEEDAFGKDYDTDATFPEKPVNEGVTAPVENENGEAKNDVELNGTNASATVRAGTKLVDGATKLTLTVTELNESNANITLGDSDVSKSIDVHIDGVSATNDKPIIVSLGAIAPIGQNEGNFKLYHVENSQTVEMTPVATEAELTAHNQFCYAPETGEVTVAMATFSEVALVSDTENAWNGEFDYSWYTNAVAPLAEDGEPDYVIANADQLAAFGAIVGGMNGQTQDSFTGKTVKLLADINLGDKDNENSDLIFYPIGYYNSTESYEKESGVSVTSDVNSFEGTFDGNGHTVMNFYQNTWEMFGDYNSGYSGTPNHYKDAMGLFGYVKDGTVKNLTVDNFSSDGEFTPTGVIAAYAVNSTFENIAITNCNPRVYNTGNGGIVGIGGDSSDTAASKLIFKNITIDNTNKISALWGSWDVACGGLMGMFFGPDDVANASRIEMTNCHVAAQIDVNNDVCGNYQYYWYRYSGMMVGTIDYHKTENGYTVPDTSMITASGCTVHFGEWNDYYYCELVANSLASYTHDHQFSRLEQVDYVDTEDKTVTVGEKTTAIPTSGKYNYVVVNGDASTENATCYHFVDGAIWNHEDAGKETVNGETVLKEDKQIVYLPFNQLFTGYGWGVKNIPVYNGEDYAFDGITILDRVVADSVEKFEVIKNELTNNREYTLGSIFNLVDNGIKLVPGALTVTVTNLDENNPVSATVVYDRENWENGTLEFAGTGNVKITIQDYYFCTPTELTVEITERQSEVKFDVVMNNGDFLHRVGNSGTVALDKLFKAKDGVTVGAVSVIVEAVDGTGASGAYSNNAIQFSGTGVVKVTITDNDWCIPTELYLEVVDAVNATTATSATSNNVVLLNDIGSGFTVSGEYTVFGNGFTLNYTGDGQYLNNGLRQGVVNVSGNGRLDNLRIKASIYPEAYLYYVEAQKGPSSVEGDKTRYHYQLSAVVAKDNATISNCYIYGGRNNIFVDTGNVTITDTVTECGTLANIQIQSTNASTVTLNNITTIQYRVNATIGDTAQVMLGAGVIVGPDTETNPNIVLNGDFKQYNWVTAEDKAAITNSTAQTIIQTALDATAFNHTVNGKTASNLGIIYLNNADANVTDETGLPYAFGNVTMLNQEGKVYSLQNATDGQIYSDYENADRATVNGDYLPTFEFNLGDQEISYDGSEDTRYLYGDKNGVTALYKDGEDPLTLDLTKLATVYKYEGIPYTVTVVCKNSSGNTLSQNNGVVTLNAQGSYTIVFTVNDNIFYDKNGQTITKSVSREFSVPLTLTVKAADIKNAEVSITKTALDGDYTTVNLTDYKLRINFLDCISVTDYDNKGTGTTVDLASNISSATLTPASVNVFTTASTVTVTYTDGRVLTVNLSKISGSSPGTKTATVNTSGGLYFITEGALNDKPTESSSQNICTITSVSYKGNSGSTVTNDTDVTVAWELGSEGSGGCVTPDTLVTLADGTQKRIDAVTYDDMLLVWDFVNGEYVVMPSIIVMNHGYDDYTVVKLKFEDGTTVNTINGHGFFDTQTNEFVLLGAENVAEYVGHDFVKVDGDGYTTTKLVDYTITNEYTESWSVLTAEHYNCILEDMWTITAAEVEDSPKWLMPFEVNDDMNYDADKMQADIDKYGLYTYDDFADYCTFEQFNAFNFPIFKVSVEKGYITWAEIEYLLGIHLAK